MLTQFVVPCLLATAPLQSGDPGAEEVLSVHQTSPLPAPTHLWIDYDGDGLRDLHVLTPGAPDRLSKNLGAAGFEEVTADAGLADLASARRAFWRDFDGNGSPDLLSLGGDGALRLFQNLGTGSFEEISASAGLETIRGVRAVIVLDVDQDGLPDLDLVAGDRALLLHNTGRGSFERVELDLPLVASGSPAPGLLPPGDPEVIPEPAEEGRPAAPDKSPPGTRKPLGAPGSSSSRRSPPGVTVQPFGSTPSPSPAATFCADEIVDQAGGPCLEASTIPLPGLLYPLGIDFCVDGNGRVGLGTLAPTSQLHLHNQYDSRLTIEADTDNVDENDNAQIRLSQDGGGVIGKIGYRDGSNQLEIINGGTDGASQIIFGTQSVDRMIVDAAGTVHVLHMVYSAFGRFGGRDAADVRCPPGHALDILQAELHARFVGHGQQVKDGVGRSAHGHVQRKGVLERLLVHDLSRQHPVGVAAPAARPLPGHHDDPLRGDLEQAQPRRARRQTRAVARRGHADCLGQAVHAVGREHPAA